MREEGGGGTRDGAVCRLPRGCRPEYLCPRRRVPQRQRVLELLQHLPGEIQAGMLRYALRRVSRPPIAAGHHTSARSFHGELRWPSVLAVILRSHCCLPPQSTGSISVCRRQPRSYGDAYLESWQRRIQRGPLHPPCRVLARSCMCVGVPHRSQGTLASLVAEDRETRTADISTASFFEFFRPWSAGAGCSRSWLRSAARRTTDAGRTEDRWMIFRPVLDNQA